MFEHFDLMYIICKIENDNPQKSLNYYLDLLEFPQIQTD